MNRKKRGIGFLMLFALVFGICTYAKIFLAKPDKTVGDCHLIIDIDEGTNVVHFQPENNSDQKETKVYWWCGVGGRPGEHCKEFKVISQDSGTCEGQIENVVKD